MYYTHHSHQTSIVGKNCVYYIQIFYGRYPYWLCRFGLNQIQNWILKNGRYHASWNYLPGMCIEHTIVLMLTVLD